jgi:ferrochelatase
MIQAVLLIAFGGPTAPDEIRPFLQNVARGRAIPPARLEEVAHHYERMPGGRSPLNELTVRQARALAETLAADGSALPVFVGMRNWHPYLHETLAEMAGQGARRALGIILSPLRTEASWARYMRDVAEARARTPAAPEVVFAPAWFEHPRFVAAAAARCRRALDEVPAGERAATPLVFTAHSVPVPMAEASPYAADFAAAAGAVAAALGHGRWSLAYQSRSGSPRDRWLEPDVNDVLKALGRQGARHVVVVPLGFVCDHVEVLYDLDVEARATAATVGLALHRAAAVNDHPDFIAALADLVRRHVAEEAQNPVGGTGVPSSGTLSTGRSAPSPDASFPQPPETRPSEDTSGPTHRDSDSTPGSRPTRWGPRR